MIKTRKTLDNTWEVNFNGQVTTFSSEPDAKAYVEKIRRLDPIERWRYDRHMQRVKS